MEHVSLRRSSIQLALVLGLLSLSSACAESNPEGASPVSEVTDVGGTPLGSVAIPVSSCSPEVATHLRRGTALLHHMTFTQAESEFRAALERDEGCALAYWGVAMSYLHPLWPDVTSDDEFEEGLELLAEARNQGPLSGREEVFISALESYYRDGKGRPEAERLRSYHEGWERALSEFPDDPEVRLFWALSLTAVAGNETSAPRVAMQIEAGQMAEEVLREIPDHPGAQHYIIHAYDLPALAEGALSAAQTYGELAPGNHHALHMTSHIFTRLGLWPESIEYNRRSEQIALNNPIDGMINVAYLHAADYRVYALLQRLEDDGARQVWNEMASLEGPIEDHPAAPYAFAAVPARIALERKNWSDASRLPSRWPSIIPWDRSPQFEAITEFARGLGAARTGDVEAAETAAAKLAALRAPAAAVPGAYNWGIQVQIQEVTVRAWIAYAEGRVTQALALMNEAHELELTTEKSPVTPGAVLPTGELLGDMLLELGRHADAMHAYEAELVRSPNRFNSLFGAGRAAESAGDIGAARGYYRRLVERTISDSDNERLIHARRFLDRG